MYKEENGVLRICKKNIVSEPPKLLKIVQSSFTKYLEETCYENVEYLGYVLLIV